MKDFYFSDSINQEIILEDKWIIILYHRFKIMWINLPIIEQVFIKYCDKQICTFLVTRLHTVM